MLILPMTQYGAETWTITSPNERALRVFVSKIIRRIFGHLRVSMNELYCGTDIVQRINTMRLTWQDHVLRMKDNTPVRNIAVEEDRGFDRMTRWKEPQPGL